ncbi:MAG: AI-2E family transporter [Prochloraceae cyanobacterium]|nr:AI-2E family transporter [Prochloraceae cyanobacterium]
MNFGQWLGFVCLIISIYILWQIRQILLLIFTAVVLSTALNRLVRRLQSSAKIKQRSLALGLTLSFTLLVSVLFIFLIVPPFIDQFQQLIQLVPDVWIRLTKQLQLLEEQLPTTIPNLPELEGLISQIPPLATELFKNFFEFFQNSLAVVLKLLLLLVLTVMLLANPQEYRQGFIQLFPSFYRKRASEILDTSEEALGNWLGAITINCIFIGSLSGIGLLVIGVKLLLAHALLAGLLNFIPNIGPATSVIFPVMVALLDDPWKIVAILIWYVVIQNIETYWLTPKLMKERASLLPAVTLFSQIFFATTFGLFGLVLALPLTVVVKAWIEEVLFKDVLDKWEVKEEIQFASVTSVYPELPEPSIKQIEDNK